MSLQHIPLSRQITLMFMELKEELMHLNSGTVFLHIRNNVIGKFGIRHDPLENRNGIFQVPGEGGLSEQQFRDFCKMAVESLKYKKHWTHGEIAFEFAIRHGMLCASVCFESNYNMANLTDKLEKMSL